MWGDDPKGSKRSPSSLDRYQRIKSKDDIFYSGQSNKFTYQNSINLKKNNNLK